METKVCHICGEEKDAKQFHRIKRFRVFRERRVVWCQDCQKMYVVMRRQEGQEKELAQKEWVFCVKFG